MTFVWCQCRLLSMSLPLTKKTCHQVVACNRKDYQPLGKAQVPHQHQPLTQTDTILKINGQGAPDSVSTIRLGLSVCLNVAQFANWLHE